MIYRQVSERLGEKGWARILNQSNSNTSLIMHGFCLKHIVAFIFLKFVKWPNFIHIWSYTRRHSRYGDAGRGATRRDKTAMTNTICLSAPFGAWAYYPYRCIPLSSFINLSRTVAEKLYETQAGRDINMHGLGQWSATLYKAPDLVEPIFECTLIKALRSEQL